MTALPYAEVIGDPIAHSKSPLIHRFWLDKIGHAAEYRATRVTARQLPQYLGQRRADPYWRGCSVTAPLKRLAAAAIGDPTGVCASLGAVNCVVRTPLGCTISANTDIAGLVEALAGVSVAGGKACIIGAGGAAWTALCYLVQHRVDEIAVIARDAAKAGTMRQILARPPAFEVHGLADAALAMRGAGLVINASPLGMTGAPGMPQPLLDALPAGATLLDMVYAPVETELLAAARAKGMTAIDGLAMLVGQAAPAFELFFGAPAPRQYDAELRALLAA